MLACASRSGATSLGPPRAGRGAVAGSTPWPCAKRFGSTDFGLCLTKLDVLDGRGRSGLCGLSGSGGDATPAPSGAEGYDRIVPVYEDLPGWSESTVGRRLEDLPANARAYLKCIEETVGAPSTSFPRARTALKPSCFGILDASSSCPGAPAHAQRIGDLRVQKGRRRSPPPYPPTPKYLVPKPDLLPSHCASMSRAMAGSVEGAHNPEQR